MAKQKWITKKELAFILKTYSIRTDEFQPFNSNEFCYVSRYAHGYMISITNELQHGSETTGRILVTHTKGNGHITFNDIWERDTNGNLQFCFRNPQDIPLTDMAYIKDLQQQVCELKSAGQKLEEQLKESLSGQTEFSPQINVLMLENERLQKQIALLTAENQKLINGTKRNARGAGRKPDPEHIKAKAQEIQSLLEAGKTPSEIQKTLSISRSSFFRYKKILKELNNNNTF